MGAECRGGGPECSGTGGGEGVRMQGEGSACGGRGRGSRMGGALFVDRGASACHAEALRAEAMRDA